jgi:Domain of unknown function (DUF4149)
LSTRRLRQLAAWLAGAWSGLIAGTGFVAAPMLFEMLARADAARVAARLFQVDAYLGLALGAVLLVLALRVARDRPEGGSRFSVEMMLALGALFCIVAGYFALQPAIEAVRAGTSGVSFAVLHGVASAFFVVKFGAVAVLAWRLAASPPAATAAVPTS